MTDGLRVFIRWHAITQKYVVFFYYDKLYTRKKLFIFFFFLLKCSFSIFQTFFCLLEPQWMSPNCTEMNFMARGLMRAVILDSLSLDLKTYLTWKFTWPATKFFLRGYPTYFIKSACFIWPVIPDSKNFSLRVGFVHRNAEYEQENKHFGNSPIQRTMCNIGFYIQKL